MKKSLLSVLGLVAFSAMIWLISAKPAAALNAPKSLNQHPILLAQTENGSSESPADESSENNGMNEDEKKGMEEEQQGIEEQEKGLQEEENGMEDVEKGMEEDSGD